MTIEPGMNLGQLLYLMPHDAVYGHAYTLRAALLRDYRGQRTQDIPAPVWADLVGAIMADTQLCEHASRRKQTCATE